MQVCYNEIKNYATRNPQYILEEITMSEKVTLYTIGHSNHPIQAFISLLQLHNIRYLVDVRSQPYSRRYPQFNREDLLAALHVAGVVYMDLGQSLGGRPQQSDLYDPGCERPNYDRQARTPLYQGGLQQLCRQAKLGSTAMMCSEGDPEVCHRTLLITPSLLDLGYDVQHILPTGDLRTAEKRPQQLSLF